MLMKILVINFENLNISFRLRSTNVKAFSFILSYLYFFYNNEKPLTEFTLFSFHSRNHWAPVDPISTNKFPQFSYSNIYKFLDIFWESTKLSFRSHGNFVEFIECLKENWKSWNSSHIFSKNLERLIKSYSI